MDGSGAPGDMAGVETRLASWRLKGVLWFLMGIGLLGGLLRLLELYRQRLWADEIFNIGVAKLGPWGIFSVPMDEEAALGPIEPMVLGFIAPHTQSVFLLKLPSALIGVITIFLMYKVVSSILGWRVGLLGAFLLAISHYHIHYSQEARFYALFVFTSLLSLYFFFAIVLRGKRGLFWWAGYGFSLVLVVYSHLFGFFVLLSQALFGLWQLGWSCWRANAGFKRGSRFGDVVFFGLTIMVALVAYAPLMPRLWAVLVSGGQYYTFRALNTHLKLELIPSLVGRLLRDYSWGYPFVFLVVLCAVGGAVYLCRKRHPLFVFSLLWFTAPFAILLAMQPSHFFAIRYVIFFLPIYLILVAHGVCETAEIAVSIARQWVAWRNAKDILSPVVSSSTVDGQSQEGASRETKSSKGD